MKLICEVSDQVSQKKDEKQNYYIEGIFIQGNLKNGNGRIYPTETLIKEVNRYKTQYIEAARAVGELDHPDSPMISLDRVSHKIVSLEQDGNNFIGKALVLDTPRGKTVKGLIDGGVRLAVSTRGVGSIKEANSAAIVQPDFVLATIDIVSDPSAPHAFVNGIMEGKEWIYENGILKPREIEALKTSIKKSRKPVNESLVLKQFKKLMDSLL